jgi:hypothetical protein
VSDCTSIDDGDIRTFFKEDESIPFPFQGVYKSLGLELVHFTSECGNGDRGHLVENSEKVALHYSKYFFDNSKARFTANRKLALQAQTSDLQTFRFAKNCYRKNLNSHSELPSSVFYR